MSTNHKLRQLSKTLPIMVEVDPVTNKRKTRPVTKYGHELIAANHKLRGEHGELMDPDKKYTIEEGVPVDNFKLLKSIHKTGGMDAVNKYVDKATKLKYVKEKGSIWRYFIRQVVKLSTFLTNKTKSK